jgi:hypothetical protein
VITIETSKTASTGTCDFSQVTKQQLEESTLQHIRDVRKGLQFFAEKLMSAGVEHDLDKLTGLDQFHSVFVTKFKETGWFENHCKINRHHLSMSHRIPDDVNLVDVIEMIVDCVMAGMGRSGNVYPIDIPSCLLEQAFNNTFELLKSQVNVIE